MTDEYGNECTYNMNIPSAGLITEVLLNYELIDLDYDFQCVFPQLDYARYVNEVIVSFPTEDSKGKVISFEIFEEFVNDLLTQRNWMSKVISIDPGNPAVPCVGGALMVCPDGIIHLMEKR